MSWNIHQVFGTGTIMNLFYFSILFYFILFYFIFAPQVIVFIYLFVHILEK